MSPQSDLDQDPQDNHLFLAAELFCDPDGSSEVAASLKEATLGYVENNDELFWEEQKSPDAIARLADCDFTALAWYFRPQFEALLGHAAALRDLSS